MILDEGTLPPRYREEFIRLLSMIEVATNVAGVRDAGRYAEGVVRGIEIARSMREADIEELYLLIYSAVETRLG
jgi:hypothetical protein